MNYNEVIQAIENAQAAILEYKRQEMKKMASSTTLTEQKEIRRKSEMLLKEAFMSGPSGTPCPTCHGTGVI